MLDTITREVAKGEKVPITGFGSFEKRVREARWVRNPATGARMKSKKTSVPRFSAGSELEAVVSGSKKLAAVPAAKKAPTKSPSAAKKRPAKKTAAKKAPAKKTTAKKAPAKKTTAKKAPATKKGTGSTGPRA